MAYLIMQWYICLIIKACPIILKQLYAYHDMYYHSIYVIDMRWVLTASKSKLPINVGS